MKKQPDKGKITALYERLSHDDERAGESVSIENQKRILEDYAQKNGFTNIRHFTDDGVRGTTFKRPGLDAMLEEIRAGNVAIIILLWLISGEVRHAIKFALIFAMVLVVEYASLWIPNDTLKMMVSFLLFIVARSLSMVIMCLWMSAGLCVDDLITSLQNMHIPKGFTITVAVVFRYIPTIGREFRNINNTMKMRGIAFNAKNLFFQPGRTMEYALVPLIMRSIKVADDLSASAMTRGLDLQTKRTSYREVRLHLHDFLITVLFVALILVGRYLTPMLLEGRLL